MTKCDIIVVSDMTPPSRCYEPNMHVVSDRYNRSWTPATTVSQNLSMSDNGESPTHAWYMSAQVLCTQYNATIQSDSTSRLVAATSVTIASQCMLFPIVSPSPGSWTELTLCGVPSMSMWIAGPLSI